MIQIKKMSSYMLAVLNFLLVFLPLKIAVLWLFIESQWMKNLIGDGPFAKAAKTPEALVNFAHVEWTFPAKVIGVSADIVQTLPLFVGLFALRAIFKKYREGEIFSAANAAQIRRLGWLFFWNALLAKPLGQGLEVMAASWSNSPDHRYFSIGFGAPHLEAIFCGVLLIVISWVMLEASRFYDEQKLTI